MGQGIFFHCIPDRSYGATIRPPMGQGIFFSLYPRQVVRGDHKAAYGSGDRIGPLYPWQVVRGDYKAAYGPGDRIGPLYPRQVVRGDYKAAYGPGDRIGPLYPRRLRAFYFLFPFPSCFRHQMTVGRKTTIHSLTHSLTHHCHSMIQSEFRC